MRDHANAVLKKESSRSRGLQHFVERRSRGEPLQYILGSEFFGDLEIQCRPGVLIPRSAELCFYSALCSFLIGSSIDKKQLRPLRISSVYSPPIKKFCRVDFVCSISVLGRVAFLYSSIMNSTKRRDFHSRTKTL